MSQLNPFQRMRWIFDGRQQEGAVRPTDQVGDLSYHPTPGRRLDHEEGCHRSLRESSTSKVGSPQELFEFRCWNRLEPVDENGARNSGVAGDSFRKKLTDVAVRINARMGKGDPAALQMRNELVDS
ncbi:MAG: hypothetical protein JKY37_18225 [Nannocystaceae bacterium]|nr:hypothetical protein [Nannocystaceae bacterium]